MEADQIGQEQEEAAAAREKLSGFHRKGTHIRHGFNGRARPLWTLFIQSSWQRGKSLRLEQFPDGGRAERDFLLLEGQADVVNRMVLFAQGDDLGKSGRLFGLSPRTGSGGGEVIGIGLAQEGVTEDPESAGGVAEGSGDFLRGTALDVECAERFVLALLWELGFEEEGARIC